MTLVKSDDNLGFYACIIGFALRWMPGCVERLTTWWDSQAGHFRKCYMRRGLTQGDSISPAFFVVFFCFTTLLLILLVFADDSTAVAVGSSWQEVDSILAEFIAEFEKWCLDNDQEVSTEKSEIMFLRRRSQPSEIAKVPVYNTLCCLGVYLNSSWSFSSHVAHLIRWTKVRIILLQRLRHDLKFSFLTLLNVVVCWRSKFIFGTHWILKLSFTNFLKVSSSFTSLLRAALGYNRLVSSEFVHNWCGVTSLREFLTYWLSKTYFTNSLKGDKSLFSRYKNWKKSELVRDEKYAFRHSTRIKSIQSFRKKHDNFPALMHDFGPSICRHLESLKSDPGVSPFTFKKILKSKFMTMRITKILTGTQIKKFVKNKNEEAYEKIMSS